MEAVENWKWVPGYKGLYEISDLGRVRSYYKRSQGGWVLSDVPQEVKSINNKAGYLYIGLSKNGVQKNFYVHRLVLLAFGVTPSECEEAGHLDGNPGNNRLDNLKWLTHQENTDMKRIHGTVLKGSQIGTSKLKTVEVIEIKKLLKKKVPQSTLAKRFKVTQANISVISTGKGWKHAA